MEMHRKYLMLGINGVVTKEQKVNVLFKAIDKVMAWFDGKIKITLNPPVQEDVIISRLKAGEFKRWLDE